MYDPAADPGQYRLNNGQYTDTGWIDVTPAPICSLKYFLSDTKWMQYRVYPDGSVRFRGTASRDNGANFGINTVGYIPAQLCGAMIQRIFSVQNGTFYVDESGALYVVLGFATLCVDGVFFQID